MPEFLDSVDDVYINATRDIVFTTGGVERGRLSKAGLSTGPFSPMGVDVRSFSAKCDGTTDDATALNNALAAGAGAYVIPAGKTIAVGSPITLPTNAWVVLMPGATIKALATLNSSTLFTQSTASTPNVRCGVVAPFGRGIIDPSLCTGMTIFDLHSPQFNHFEGLLIMGASDQTGTVFKVRCDVTTLGGDTGSNKNSAFNYIGKINCGKNGTFLDMQGAATSTQVVTLNTIEHINALNMGTGFITIGPYADNNYFVGMMRTSINQNNAVGLNIAADANTYFNCFQSLQIDTFVGKTGRIGVQLGSGSSRTMIYGYFNDPAAEGGQIVDNGSLSHYINGEWIGTGAISSGLSVVQRGVGPISQVQAITYSATMASDCSLVADKGVFTVTPTNTTAMTMSNPTNVAKGQEVTYDFLNSSGGVMGAITWGGNFQLAGAFTNPANGKHRTITFYSPDGTVLREKNRAAADI